MAKQKKKAKKQTVVPCTDANQRIRERHDRIKKQNDYIINKIAQLRAQQELARKQRTMVTGDAGESTIVSGLQEEKE